MSFSIRFLNELDAPPPSSEDAIGEVVFEDLREQFCSSLTGWTREQYEAQWKAALTNLLEGSEKAALITNFADAYPRMWWSLYRQGETVLIHEQALTDEPSTPFDLKRMSKYIHEYRRCNEDGLLISEWETSMDAIAQFLLTLN